MTMFEIILAIIGTLVVLFYIVVILQVLWSFGRGLEKFGNWVGFKTKPKPDSWFDKFMKWISKMWSK